MWGEIGHHFPAFPLADALRARGHDVVFASVPDLGAEIEARGFRWYPIHADVRPAGSLAAMDRAPLDHDALLVNRVRFGDEWLGGAVERVFRAVNPAIILVDVISWGAAFVAHGLGIPCLRLTTSLSQSLEDGIPPLTSSLLPDAVRGVDAAKLRESRFADAQQLSARFARYLSARWAYPWEAVSFDTVLVPAATLHAEVLLCEPPLDFPRAGPASLYFGAPVEVDRREDVPEALSAFLDGPGPVLFASLGSLPGRYASGGPFFRAVLGALRARPHWRAVIATGDRHFEACLAESPSNVLVLRRAPQMHLLRRASAFLTHAGLGSIREAIALGTPLIVVPQGFDQPGNAARVVHHALGLRLDPESITVEGVVASVVTILADREGYRSRLAEMDRRCRAAAARSPLIEEIERRARPGVLQPPQECGDGDEDFAARGGWAFVSDDVALAGAVSGPGTARSPSIGDALWRGSGPVLLRLVRLARPDASDGGHAIMWSADFSRSLVEFTDWCAAATLEDERRAMPDRHASIRREIEELRALRARTETEPLEVARRLTERLQLLWQVGYSEARVLRRPFDGARLARWHMMSWLGLRRAAGHVGTNAGAALFAEGRVEGRGRADAELLRLAMQAEQAQGRVA
jgi:zeaxanthin glucosyltransferase